MWSLELLFDSRGYLCSIVMIQITVSLDLISDFCGMLWQPFYPLLTKEPKNLCFSPNKNIG